VMEREEIATFVIACLETLKERNCKHILLDNRGIVPQKKIGTLDIYAMPAFLETLGMPRHIRVAAISPEECRQDFSFLETVCQNSGYQIFVFYALAPAVDWLTQ